MEYRVLNKHFIFFCISKQNTWTISCCLMAFPHPQILVPPADTGEVHCSLAPEEWYYFIYLFLLELVCSLLFSDMPGMVLWLHFLYSFLLSLELAFDLYFILFFLHYWSIDHSHFHKNIEVFFQLYSEHTQHLSGGSPWLDKVVGTSLILC